jgi:exopolyphosphatase/guanosine-5'-triphosphate,3'-diphosphate pyrophosphatase
MPRSNARSMPLRRFGEQLRGFAPEQVRAVATDAMRVARNADLVLPQAEAALGFPIEIIGGREEARLIFIGAANALPPATHRRLVVDIGGGSTELIIGQGIEPLLMESLFMGGINFRQRFFPDGKVDGKRFRAAEVAAASADRSGGRRLPALRLARGRRLVGFGAGTCWRAGAERS